jgi:hypothetical protein
VGSLCTMRRSRELVILIVLLITGASFVLGYVINRRAKTHANPSRVIVAQPSSASPVAPDLGPIVVAAAPPSAETKRTALPADSSRVLIEPLPVPIPPQVVTPSVQSDPPNPAPPVEVLSKPEPAVTPASDESVELGGANEGKTIDFTTGKPVTKDSPEEKAIIESAVKDMTEAKKTIIFKAPEKPVEPTAPPPEK